MRQFSHGNQKERKGSGLDNEIFTMPRKRGATVPDCATRKTVFRVKANINYGFVSV